MRTDNARTIVSALHGQWSATREGRVPLHCFAGCDVIATLPANDLPASEPSSLLEGVVKAIHGATA